MKRYVRFFLFHYFVLVHENENPQFDGTSCRMLRK
jgi:hypothetical protein